jgi:ABC-type cobalamin/Fe3+-siderophores transport system ATPase subunit
VFLDEPTAAMDLVAERDVMERLGHLAHEHHRAVVLVTHYLGLVAKYADKVLFLDVDNRIVIAGDTAAVLREGAFRDRYGAVLEDDAA